MKLVLPDALHARPANLLVRVASRHVAVVEVWKGGCRADARKILDVLSLGAAKGDELELRAHGDDADQALEAIATLILRNFDADLVPETGAAAAPGIAIGRAVVVGLSDADDAPESPASVNEAIDHVRAAVAHAERDLDALLRALPPDEAQLFEPERAILRDLEPRIVAEVTAGTALHEAVRVATEPAVTDLLLDARRRLLDALRGEPAIDVARFDAIAPGEPLVVVAEVLTPSLVASLPPRVVGIVAGGEAPTLPVPRGGVGTHTSHAAILARGRELPLAFVPMHVVGAIPEGELVVVDTTTSPARVWIDPSDALLGDARARRVALEDGKERDETRAAAEPLGVPVELLVNVGSTRDRVPPGVVGIGLLRTELVFAGATAVPSVAAQVEALRAIADRARGGVVTARLFDAGGDKPLPWLAPPDDDPDARGIALLFHHPRALDAQLAALAAVSASAKVRVLLPMVRSADDVHRVRARAPGLPIGAMIETPEAAHGIGPIAAAADFVCIGTNDLTALTLGIARGDAARGLDPRVLTLVHDVARATRRAGRKVTVCGEIAADPRGACILVGMGVDALSVAPSCVAELRLALRDVTPHHCRLTAEAALTPPSEAGS